MNVITTYLEPQLLDLDLEVDLLLAPPLFLLATGLLEFLVEDLPLALLLSRGGVKRLCIGAE